MMEAYREMLTYIKSAVTRNYSEKCISNIMDFVSGSASQNFSLLEEFYQTTLKALEEAKNEVRTLSYSAIMWSCCPSSDIFFSSAEALVQDKSKALQNLVRHGWIWTDEQSIIVFCNFILCISKCLLQLCQYNNNLALLDFEGASQVLSNWRWFWWSKERNTAVGGVRNWNSNVYWDQEQQKAKGRFSL